MIVTAFKNFADKEASPMPYTKVLDLIKEGRWQKHVEPIRKLMEEGKKEEANELKKKLIGICFNGLFKQRKNEALEQSSGLMILDFDSISDITFADKLQADEFIHAYWVSPSGTGYKALVKIPQVKDDAEFKTYFLSFMERYPEIDPSGKDICRFCFVSFDPALVIKPDSSVWYNKKEIEQPKAKSPAPTPGKLRSQTDWKKMAIGLDMIAQAEIGNRHTTILKAGRVMGGYIGSGEVQESDVLSVFENEIQNKDPQDFKDNWRTFQQGIDHGKREPFSTEEIKKENKLGDIDFVLDSPEVKDKVLSIYKDGYPKGYHVGWDCMKDHYTILMGGTTYLYGSPFSGKTYWWFEVLINLSTFYDMKHALFSPETGDPEDVYTVLCEIKAGRDFTNKYKNQMTEKERDETMEWVTKHFIVIDPQDAEMTMKDCLDYVDLIERKYNTKIHTITIDPHNELEEDIENGEFFVKSLERELKMVRRNAKKNKRHICIITHIRDQDPIKEKTITYYPIPTPRDIFKGQTWYRKGLMMLSFWRPMVYHTQEPFITIGNITYRTDATIIQIQKAKPKYAGKIGQVEMFFDPKRHRFYEGSNLYAHKIEDSTIKPEPLPLFFNPSNVDLKNTDESGELFDDKPPF